MKKLNRIFDLLDNYRNEYPEKKDIFAGKQDGKWKRYSTNEFIELVDNVSLGLLSLSLKKGDKIATISNNRPEWNIVDHAIFQAGMVHVPLYPTIGVDDYKYILNHCDAKIIIISDSLILNKIKGFVADTPNIESIYTFNKTEGEKFWLEIAETGKNAGYDIRKQLELSRDEVKPDDLATIIYTSGTTGVMKGVMLSHWNIMSNVLATSKIQPMDSTCKALSFLPLSHIYERMMNYQYQYLGISIYYAENMGTIANDLKEIKPHGFCTVPRLLEKLYDKIIEKGKDLKGIKRLIFFWAVKLGLKYKEGASNGWFYRFKLKIARKLVFSKWKAAVGGNIKIIVTGGSAVQERLQRIFWAADIPILEGYGLTEASPVISTSKYDPSGHKFGTVGPILEGVTIKIAEDGEILATGPNIMLGYYKDPQATSEVIDDQGWLQTGDIGVLVDNKFLKITDRKKEIFKISSGKYVAPQQIENKLKESFYIEQVMVIGENEKFASALISPYFSALHDWCSENKIHFRNNEELILIPQVVSLIQKEVISCTKNLGATEQIKRFKIVADEWTPATGELTPSLKLRRRVIYNKYSSIIKEIYNYGTAKKITADK